MAFDALKNLDNVLLNVFDIKPSSQARRYMYTLSLAAIAMLVLGAFFWGYRYYAGQQEKNAQKTLASCIKLYEEAAGANGTPASWSIVETSCKRGHEEYAKSGLAPYFLSYQAEALIKQNKIDDAIVVMTQMVNSLSKNSPLYYIYATKLALVQTDASDASVKAAGLKSLEELAVDTKNKQRDEALYYVGLYHWHHNDTAKAKEAWQQLAELPRLEDAPAQGQENASPWMQLVAERLNVIA
jgi:hypothetical protein